MQSDKWNIRKENGVWQVIPPARLALRGWTPTSCKSYDRALKLVALSAKAERLLHRFASISGLPDGS